jgi:hypothetical protein
LALAVLPVQFLLKAVTDQIQFLALSPLRVVAVENPVILRKPVEVVVAVAL